MPDKWRPAKPPAPKQQFSVKIGHLAKLRIGRSRAVRRSLGIHVQGAIQPFPDIADPLGSIAGEIKRSAARVPLYDGIFAIGTGRPCDLVCPDGIYTNSLCRRCVDSKRIGKQNGSKLKLAQDFTTTVDPLGHHTCGNKIIRLHGSLIYHTGVDNMQFNDNIKVQYSCLGGQSGPQGDLFLNTILNQSEYDRLEIFVRNTVHYLPEDQIQETMAVLWDIRKHAVELCPTFQQLPLSFDDTIESWLDGTSYTAAEKADFVALYNDRSKLLSEDRKCKCFIKAESYPEIKYPRPIKSRTDRFKAIMGALFQGINDSLFSNTKWFIKKTPVDLRPSRIMDVIGNYTQVDCTDYSSFEAHFIDMMIYTIEFPFYYWVTMQLPSAEWWRRELTTLLRSNLCIFKDFILDSMSRASGEMNTSSGNGFSNLVLYTYATRVKGAVEQRGQFEGDDGITNTLPDIARPTTQDFKNLGWSCKLESHNTISEASFCGIVADVDEKVNVTNIRNYLLDFGWTKQQYLEANDNTIKALIRAKGFSAIYQYRGCPIIEELGRYALRVTQDDYTITKFNKMIHMKNFYDNRYRQEQFLELLQRHQSQIPDRKPIGPNTRNLVERLYGITSQQQIDIENYLANLNQIQPLDIDLEFPEVTQFMWDTFVGDEIYTPVEPQNEIARFKDFVTPWPNVKVDL